MKDLDLIYFRYARRKTEAIAEAQIPYCELTMVLKGSFEYFVDREPVVLSGGDAVYIPEGSLRARSTSEEEVEYVSFNFRTDTDVELPRHISGCLGSELRLELALCEELFKKYYSCDREKVNHLLACVLLSLKENIRERLMPPLVNKIIEYLHTNIAKKITLADIGNYTFFSPVYCDTVFKRETGRSIIDYLLDMRVEEAKRLLIEGDLPLKKIADAVGIGDYNYFSRIFKKRTGYTPVQYQKMVGR